MRWLRRLLLLLLLVVVLVVVGGAYTVNRYTRGVAAQSAREGTLRLAGLSVPVEVLWDAYGVPHLYATSPADLFFSQGYIQASERWWQMDLARHTGRGELSALLGGAANLTGSDVFIRTVGWRASAERDYAALDDATRADLQAFADGVNAFLGNRSPRDIALEYTVLQLGGRTFDNIRPWDPVDSLAWAKVLQWDLSGNRGNELARERIAALVGEDMMQDYFPAFPYDERATILLAEDLGLEEMGTLPPVQDAAPGQAAQWGTGLALAGNITPFQDFGFGHGLGVGSNNWVVSGTRSTSGAPLLANDPHIGATLPPTWFEIGLHCRPVSDGCPFDVVGYALPAAPWVVTGRNTRIAWGVTNVGPDVQDLYRIEVNPDNPVQYRWNDTWRDMTTRDEVIDTNDGRGTTTITVRETHFGPIINDNLLDDDNQPTGFNNTDPLAFRWTATAEASTVAQAIRGLTLALDWNAFREALRAWDAPSQNFVYADMDGNIGYQMPGNIPVRAPEHSGLRPVDGTSDDYAWRGFIPFEQLPSVFNPERGWVATANQPVVPPSYYDRTAAQLGTGNNYVFDRETAMSYRGQRIVDMLLATPQHSTASFQQMQIDTFSLSVGELMPYLAAVAFDDPALTDARDWLLGWDGRYDVDSPHAALYAHVWQALMQRLYYGRIGDNVAGDADRNMMATRNLLAQPNSLWWDDPATPITERRDDLLRAAFVDAHANTITALGADRAAWRWGALHTATWVNNPLGVSGLGPIEGQANIGPLPVGGSVDTVISTRWDAFDEDFRMGGAVPSYRFIADMASPDANVSIIPGGQSGHPYSPHYADQAPLWARGEWRPMVLSDAAVQAATVRRLTLQPQE